MFSVRVTIDSADHELVSELSAPTNDDIGNLPHTPVTRLPICAWRFHDTKRTVMLRFLNCFYLSYRIECGSVVQRRRITEFAFRQCEISSQSPVYDFLKNIIK